MSNASPWIRYDEYRHMLTGAVQIRDSHKLPPFICDYTRESIWRLADGDELHVYFQQFGWLRGAQLVKAAPAQAET